MSSQSTVAPRTFRSHPTEIARHPSPLSGRRRVWQPRAKQACDKCRVLRKRCYKDNISEPCVRCRSSGVKCHFANRHKSQTTRNSTTPCPIPVTPTTSHGGDNSTDDNGLAGSSSSSSSSPDAIWEFMGKMPVLQDPFHSLESLPSPLPPPLSLSAFSMPNEAPQKNAELVPSMLGGGYRIRPQQLLNNVATALLPVTEGAGMGTDMSVDMGIGMDMGEAQLLTDLTLCGCIDWNHYWSQRRKAGRFAAAT
ncbi:hypothetical protein IWX90DRAFT_86330 [Phyllosticta citrichinensis]|uniref:Zn(2)-C6 fungal-type domain-containing protein n=1 Tax=Phyllosticta citrichinensis TaxID=1130410 RepID=A0ABR1XFB2_9PEZI